MPIPANPAAAARRMLLMPGAAPALPVPVSAMAHLAAPEGLALVTAYGEYARRTRTAPETLYRSALPDGFTVTGRADGAVLILYNERMPATRQRFTLAHEIGHLACRHTSHGARQEDDANRFAAHLLMPDALIRLIRDQNVPVTEAVLMRCFGVSRAAAARKLLYMQNAGFMEADPTDPWLCLRFRDALHKRLPRLLAGYTAAEADKDIFGSAEDKAAFAQLEARYLGGVYFDKRGQVW